MTNLYTLKEAIMWAYAVIKDDDSLEEFCKILGEAIGIYGYKLQLLAFYDVEVVFPKCHQKYNNNKDFYI